MKAFLLAAGIGSRLRPLTDSTPKCMLEIGDRPMLDLWLERLHACGVDEVLVNLHHLPDVVHDHLAARPAPVTVRTSYEPELLGSAGTLLAHREWIDDEEMFIVCNADNLTDFDLRRLVEFHREADAVASLALFNAEQPSACGIVELDADGRVIGFTEKPARPLGDLANAGMYVFHPSVLDLIDTPPPADIGYHLLPRLVGRARGLRVGGYFLDIGTPDAYRRAREEWGDVA